MKQLSIVIPAYNEEQSLATFLPDVITFCKRNEFELIVVNDGSKDKTAEVLENHMDDVLQVVSHKVNKGYGGAIKSGIMQATSNYVVTIDADGQHVLEDVRAMYDYLKERDADMVIGRRRPVKGASVYRSLGKFFIRIIAKAMLPIRIHDLNSGMKMYRSDLAKKYIQLCPDGMAFSDIIGLVFVSQRHLVLEKDISIKKRMGGKSTISTSTAFETIKEILNIVVLFNPMKIFLPISVVCILFGVIWGGRIILNGKGLSTAALFALLAGIIFFFLGLIAEQLAVIRKNQIK